MLTSLRDTLLVARYELLRNLRTWRAIALCALYLTASTGGAYIFTRGLLAMETAAAEVLMVPATEKPGAMTDKLIERGDIEKLVGEMVSDDSDVVERLMQWPLLTWFHVWLAMLLIPFMAVTSAAECIAVDMQSRAVRFECVRTGRMEFVFGRFLGQVMLMAAASLLSVAGTWTVGMTAMVGNSPLELAASLLFLTPLVVGLTLPFIGMGVAFSQVTTSPNVARVLGLIAVVGSWMMWGLAHELEDGWAWWFWSPLQYAMPQEWMWKLWQPFPEWALAAAVLALLGMTFTAFGFPLFHRRDL